MLEEGRFTFDGERFMLERGGLGSRREGSCWGEVQF